MEETPTDPPQPARDVVPFPWAAPAGGVRADEPGTPTVIVTLIVVVAVVAGMLLLVAGIVRLSQSSGAGLSAYQPIAPIPGVGGAALPTATAAGPTPTATAHPTPRPLVGTPPPLPASQAALIAAAKAEGSLTTMALPHDWCHYGQMLANFKAMYGLEVTELVPDAGSTDELDALRTGHTSSGQDAPDVVDLGPGSALTAQSEGLLQPYKVASWDSVPAGQKDPDGYWYGDYYGVITFEVNSAVVTTVPKDWKDLLKPAYKAMVALPADPTTSNEGTGAVYSAALANGGSLDDLGPGLAYFHELDRAGNLLSTKGDGETVVSGDTPILLSWSYYSFSDQAALIDSAPIRVVIPPSGSIATVDRQAISRAAVHPNAARLWMEYLYSDQGQLTWLRGACFPIRYATLRAAHAIPLDMTSSAPDVSRVTFPTLAQLGAASDAVDAGWPTVVGVQVR